MRVLLADDHGITREGTRRLLEGEPDIEVVAEAADGEQTVILAQALHPDVVLLDISMPRLSGIDVARTLKRVAPQIKIVVLTGYDTQPYVDACQALGVRGFLSKSASSREVINALWSVYANGSYIQTVATMTPPPTLALSSFDSPTMREQEVLRLVGEGYKNRAIAQKLGVSERTVHFHLRNLFGKLGAQSRAELVHLARQAGWLV